MTGLYRRVVFPLLGRLDAERVHERTLSLLARAQRRSAGRWLLRRIAGALPGEPVSAFGLTFPNPLGVAAGFDKDATVAEGLALLGFGHVEVGTLTPRPQEGNPRPRVFRLPTDRALVNRMGFPNHGVEAAVPRLRKMTERGRDFVLGVSLGKQKETPLAEAVDDYLSVLRAVYPDADYLAINVSSPNTPDLRALQRRDHLGPLLSALVEEGERLAARQGISARPLLLKVAPDLSEAELDRLLADALESGIRGIIAGNTTLSREGTTHPNREEAGGLSGRPLARRSNEVIARIRRQVGDRLPIIGVGGIFDADDVRAKRDAGAALVQVYTGLVYEGPGMAGRILRALASERPAREPVEAVREVPAVGGGD